MLPFLWKASSCLFPDFHFVLHFFTTNVRVFCVFWIWIFCIISCKLFSSWCLVLKILWCLLINRSPQCIWIYQFLFFMWTLPMSSSEIIDPKITKILSDIFFSRIIEVLHFTHTSLIHLELIFLYSVKKRSNFTFSPHR